MEYEIDFLRSKEIATGTKEFYFSKPEGFEYTAGQSMDLTLLNPPETDEEGNTRSFTITSAPYESYLAIATRMRDTAFKRSLNGFQPGTKIKMTGPYGSLTLHKNASTPAVFVTGGIGVTPAHSIIKQATHDMLPHQITLLYADKTPEDMAFYGDLTRTSKDNQSFQFIPIMTRMDEASGWTGEKGHIDEGMLKRYFADIEKPIYYVTGPMQMVQILRHTLIKAGADEDKIRTEDFPGY